MTSLTAIGGDVQHGPAAFTTTHWSVVLEAQGESSAAQKALEKLCRTYWRPIYGYVRRHGAGTEDAEDLTQGFFALLLERKDLNTVRKGEGTTSFVPAYVSEDIFWPTSRGMRWQSSAAKDSG